MKARKEKHIPAGEDQFHLKTLSGKFDANDIEEGVAKRLKKGQHLYPFEVFSKSLCPGKKVWDDDAYEEALAVAGHVIAKSKDEARNKVKSRYCQWNNGYFIRGDNKLDPALVFVQDWNPKFDPTQTIRFEDLEVGKTFRAKKPSMVRFLTRSGYNDRTVVWLGISQVQYDSLTVRTGSHLPTISADEFLRWAGTEVTEKITQE